jgi:endonuclease G
MDRGTRIRGDRRQRASQAYERWKGFQPNLREIRGAEANRDGSIPRPRVGVLTFEQRARFAERERLREVVESPLYRNARITAERMIGATLDFMDLAPNEQARKAGRPVVRIVTLNGNGFVPEGFASGFLISPDLILTNHHVFRTPDEAEGIGAQFLYERTEEGLREGLIFELEPARFFVNDKRLDYAVVAVRPRATGGAELQQFRFLPLIGVKGKILKGDPVNIIQHPEGGPKRYATVNNRLLDLRDDGFLLYETDTLEGSSGSPVFNQHWETIGLHHCGVPQMQDGKLVTRDGRLLPLDAEVDDEELIWIANEGIRVTALVESLARQRLDNPAQQRILESLLATTADPLRVLAQGTEASVAAAAAPNGTSMSLGGSVMPSQLFQFTGPVTINVAAAPAAATTLSVDRTAPAPAADTEFREKKLKFDENYNKRTQRGYKQDFLAGWTVPAPTLDSSHSGTVLADNSGSPWVIQYYHYSLVMNESRRLLSWAACNVDYSKAARKFTKTRKQYGGEDWRLDPRVALAAPGMQIENADFYLPARKIDRGHIVRREDSAWGGSTKEAEFGNSDTYHWTNCTPQSEAFNQSALDGIWGQFEEHIQSQVKALGGKMSVFCGPVLNPNDPEHGYDDEQMIQVPMEFWKVIVCVAKENGQSVPLAYGFVFDQTEPVERLGYERMNMDDYEIYQMPIAEITRKTGVVFDPSVLAADVQGGNGPNESIRGFKGKRVTSLSSVILR